MSPGRETVFSLQEGRQVIQGVQGVLTQKGSDGGKLISCLARLLALWQQCSFDKERPETN